MKVNISQMCKRLKSGIQKHSPEILTGLGITGMISTTILAVRATPHAICLIEEEKKSENISELSPLETVRTVWKCYIPATATGSLSIACLIGASAVNYKRNAALATAYSLSESALKTYQEKVIETIGEKKEKSIRDEVAKDALKKDPVTNKEVIVTGRGETLCYDTTSGRYFRGDIEKLRRAEIDLNKEILRNMYVSLNDYYYMIGLSGTMIGDELGWNIDDNLTFDYSSQLADDGTPCLVVSFKPAPKYDYRKIM